MLKAIMAKEIAIQYTATKEINNKKKFTDITLHDLIKGMFLNT